MHKLDPYDNITLSGKQLLFTFLWKHFEKLKEMYNNKKVPNKEIIGFPVW